MAIVGSSEIPKIHSIVHVGAHYGQEIEDYQALNPDLIVWIEADPNTFLRLTEFTDKNSKDGIRHMCINALVSDKDDEVRDFFITSNDRESSSIFRTTELHAKFGAAMTGETLKLRTARLDSILRSAGVAPDSLDILILDVQGAEMLCLTGVGDYLKYIKLLKLEVTKETAFYEGGAVFSDLDAWLRDRDFVRISELPDGPWHGDCIYQNQAVGQERFPQKYIF
ncbi:MAG: FkbM family methyltransferase [Cyanobacteria bacterium P01_D01_bin.73]